MKGLKKMNKEHYDEMDLLKGIGIIAVYLGHSFNLPMLPWNNFLVYIYRNVYSFHLPLFFLVSGFLSNNCKDIDFIKFYKNKIKRLLIPYLFINFIDYIPRTLFPQFVNSEFEGLKEVLFYGTKISWFVYTLFILFLIFPILEKYIFRKDRYCIFGIILLILNTFKIGTDIEFLSIGTIIYYLIYFYIGYQVKKIYKDKILDGIFTKKIFFIGISILYLVFAWNYFYINLYTHIIFALIGSLFYLNIFIRMNERNKSYSLLKFYGSNSMSIYLIEGFITVVIRVILLKILKLSESNAEIIVMSFFFIRIILAYIIVKYIIIRSSILSFLLGARKE